MGTALNKPSPLSCILLENLRRCSSSVIVIEEILGIPQAPSEEDQPVDVELSNTERRLTETIAVVGTIEERLKRIEQVISIL